MKKLFLIFFAVIPTLLANCGKSNELKKHTTMALGVKFDTNNPRIIKSTVKALQYWEQVVDFYWFDDENEATCSIDISVTFNKAFFKGITTTADGKKKYNYIVALTDNIYNPEFHGNMFLNRFMVDEMSDAELDETIKHELGHEFGLLDNHNPKSLMRWIGFGSFILTPQDINNLKKLHALK